MARNTFGEFLDQIDEPHLSVIAKRLSANDTGATSGHQAGIYIAKEAALKMFPHLVHSRNRNPEQHLACQVDSHSLERDTRLVWYRQGTRDECRITRWAGRRQDGSPVDPAMTGALAVFAFDVRRGSPSNVMVWFCATADEEDLFEDRFEPVEPGTTWFRHGNEVHLYRRSPLLNPCALPIDRLPPAWVGSFPSTDDLIRMTLTLQPSTRTVDALLLRRRACEFTLFTTVEAHHVLPTARSGFSSVDQFVAFANAVTNRRRSRAGRSLELHLRSILEEQGIPHSHGGHSEDEKRPDFLFPSAQLYRDRKYPASRLRMLAAKTTCKDRWRQVIDEADRIRKKHLLTVQEGVSVTQFSQMRRAGVVLVVPAALHKHYPEAVRPHLLSLASFLADARSL